MQIKVEDLVEFKKVSIRDELNGFINYNDGAFVKLLREAKDSQIDRAYKLFLKPVMGNTFETNNQKEQKFQFFFKSCQNEINAKIEPIETLVKHLENLQSLSNSDSLEGHSFERVSEAVNDLKEVCRKIRANPNFNHLKDSIDTVLKLRSKVKDKTNKGKGNQTLEQFVEPLQSSIDELKNWISTDKIRDIVRKNFDMPNQIPLSDIFSCSDFMDIFNGPDKVQLDNLLSDYENMTYNEIKESIESSSLSPKDKKKVFAEVLPKCNFQICDDFGSIWNMFKDGYIDFETLVTKFWAKENFGPSEDRNVFRNFANAYKGYMDPKTPKTKLSFAKLSLSAMCMINGLRNNEVISDDNAQNLKSQIYKIKNVGIFRIIAQFFSHLFLKSKTAFRPISQIKQDRVIGNLKPLSKILKQTAEQNKNKNNRELT